MYGPDYVWILPDHGTTWWNDTKECNPHHLKRSVEGLILISHYNYLFENETSISGLVRFSLNNISIKINSLDYIFSDQ